MPESWPLCQIFLWKFFYILALILTLLLRSYYTCLSKQYCIYFADKVSIYSIHHQNRTVFVMNKILDIENVPFFLKTQNQQLWNFYYYQAGYYFPSSFWWQGLIIFRLIALVMQLHRAFPPRLSLYLHRVFSHLQERLALYWAIRRNWVPGLSYCSLCR